MRGSSPESSDTNRRLSESRGKFIEEYYPVLFGHEEMGDPAIEITPSDLTAILAIYEQHLVNDQQLD